MTLSDGARRTARTVVQTGLAVAAGLPLIISASGISEAAPGVAVLLGVAAGLTRVMALPMVDALLPRWLRAAAPEGPGGER